MMQSQGPPPVFICVISCVHLEFDGGALPSGWPVFGPPLVSSPPPLGAARRLEGLNQGRRDDEEGQAETPGGCRLL